MSDGGRCEKHDNWHAHCQACCMEALEAERAKVAQLVEALKDWPKTTTTIEVWKAAAGSSVVGGRMVPFMIDLLERTTAALAAAGAK